MLGRGLRTLRLGIAVMLGCGLRTLRLGIAVMLRRGLRALRLAVEKCWLQALQDAGFELCVLALQ